MLNVCHKEVYTADYLPLIACISVCKNVTYFEEVSHELHEKYDWDFLRPYQCH